MNFPLCEVDFSWMESKWLYYRKHLNCKPVVVHNLVQTAKAIIAVSLINFLISGISTMCKF